MAKKKRDSEEEDLEEGVEEGTSAASAAVVDEDEDAVYVNRDKYNRAKLIVALVSGAQVPQTDAEAEKKDLYTKKFAAAEVSPKGAEALRFAYETLLGGLVRTTAEQEAADAAARKAKAKLKKKRIEG